MMNTNSYLLRIYDRHSKSLLISKPFPTEEAALKWANEYTIKRMYADNKELTQLGHKDVLKVEDITVPTPFTFEIVCLPPRI